MQEHTLSRLEEVILFILDSAKQKGKDDLSRFELMKFVYLIEVESMKYIGRRFADAPFVRERNGPISYDIYKALERLHREKLINITPVENNPEYGFPRFCHSLAGNLPNLSFSDSEKIYLNSVLADYIGLTIRKLKDVAYKTEPMLDMLRQEDGGPVLKGQRINFDTVTLDSDIVSSIMS